MDSDFQTVDASSASVPSSLSTTDNLVHEVTDDAAPPEIQYSLAKFRNDHPDASKVAFVMMRFGRTQAHQRIVKAIKDALGPVGITAHRADDKGYHRDLFPNIQTYMHGCSFGIAVFERLEREDFNANVALEVGYMMALGKPVCLLKDRTLTSLHADLGGMLYREFDPQRPTSGIRSGITKWIADTGIELRSTTNVSEVVRDVDGMGQLSTGARIRTLLSVEIDHNLTVLRDFWEGIEQYYSGKPVTEDTPTAKQLAAGRFPHFARDIWESQLAALPSAVNETTIGEIYQLYDTFQRLENGFGSAIYTQGRSTARMYISDDTIEQIRAVLRRGNPIRKLET